MNIRKLYWLFILFIICSHCRNLENNSNINDSTGLPLPPNMITDTIIEEDSLGNMIEKVILRYDTLGNNTLR